MKLRWLAYKSHINPKTMESFSTPSTYHKLQQWWEKDFMDKTIPQVLRGDGGEWRDIPIETEK